MKFRIKKTARVPKPYWLVASGCAALVFSLVCASAYADQFNDKYFLLPGDGPLDLTHESGEKGGYFSSPQPTQEVEKKKEEQPKTNQQQELQQQSPTPVAPIETEEDALDALKEQGAISVIEEFTDEANGAFGGYSIVVDGDKVRSAIGNNVNIADVLKFWRGIKGKFSTRSEKNVGGAGRLTTGQYYALIASELAANDKAIDEAALSASRFEITYRSRGKLFAFIPFAFPVRVIVTGAAATAEDRVYVKLPWYRWFVRKYFSARSLATEIDAVVLGELTALPPGAEDVQAVLFTAVADFLKQKVRTISDSILLGS